RPSAMGRPGYTGRIMPRIVQRRKHARPRTLLQPYSRARGPVQPWVMAGLARPGSYAILLKIRRCIAKGQIAMTHQQWETIERSLIGLSPQDKLELVERLVHELRESRAVAASAAPSPASRLTPMSEEEFKQKLLKSGLMSSLPIPADPASRPAFEPITIEGERLSETIIRERR